MPLHFQNVRKAIHAMYNDVIEQAFKHSLEFPHDRDRAQKIIENSNTSLKDIINSARKNSLKSQPHLKQKAFNQTIKKAEKTSLKLLLDIQLMRRRQIMTSHKLKNKDSLSNESNGNDFIVSNSSSKKT